MTPASSPRYRPRGSTAPRAVAIERARAETGWTMLDAGAVAATLVAAFIGKEALLASPAVALMPASGQVVARALILAAFYGVQVAMLVWLAGRHGKTLRQAFRLQRGGFEGGEVWVSVVLVAGLAVVTRLASTLWGAAAQGVGWHPPQGGVESLTALFGTGGAGLGLAVTMVVVVGPLVEELVFRGVIADAFGVRWGRGAAIFGSATVFALYHVTPWLLVPTFVLGVALAYLARERRTLWPAILLHAVYNGTVVGAAYWLSR